MGGQRVERGAGAARWQRRKRNERLAGGSVRWLARLRERLRLLLADELGYERLLRGPLLDRNRLRQRVEVRERVWRACLHHERRVAR